MRRSVVVQLALVAALVAATLAGPGSHAARAEDAGEPTVGELLERIEALEKALAEVRRDASGCAGTAGAGKDAKPAASRQAAGEASAEGESPAKTETAETETAETAAEVPEKRKVVVAAASPVTAGYESKGFFVATADGAYRLRVNGLLHVDSRFFLDEDRRSDVNEFFLRRARLDFRAKIARRFGFRMTPEFSGSDLDLKDANIDIEIADWLELTAGKFKTPFGLERLDSSSDFVIAERSMVDNLVPARDVGVQLAGEIGDGTLSYAFMVGNGVPDGDSGDEDVNDAVDLAARVFAIPFKTKMYSPLRGFGFGLAATWGREQGTESDPELPSFRTATGRSRFFRYVDDNDDGTAIADGDRWRVSPQASLYEGPFGLLTEYVRSSQQIALDQERAWVANQAWQVRGGWLLTGERASPERPEPSSPFNFGRGQWGAWEIGFRWTSLDVDGTAFEKGFADPNASARHADAFAAAVNWYLNRNVSWYLDYEHTMFGGGGGDGGGDRNDEDVILTRLQLAF